MRSPIVLLTVIAICMLAPEVPPAATVYVDCDNTSGLEDGSSDHPFQLISDGMNVASFGDTVLVMPGTYSENITVDMHDPGGMNRAAVIMKDGVALASFAGPDSTAIHGVGTEAAVYLDSCGAGSRLSGFTIETSGTGWGFRTSILSWASEATIEQNTVSFWYGGLTGMHGSVLQVIGNRFLQGGLALVSGSSGTIESNEIAGGIFLDSASAPSAPLVITSNLIVGTEHRYEGTGIRVSGPPSVSILIVDNTITGKQVGAAVSSGQLHQNRFVDNGQNVVVLPDCDPEAEIDAECNWWGTADQHEIEQGIVDCVDDPQIPCCVDYVPWCLDVLCVETPVAPATWGSLKATYR